MSNQQTERQYLPHQQRVVDELKELKDKRTKLLEFIQHSDVFKTLEQIDKDLLTEQYEAMVWYDVILTKRIERF